MQYLEDIIESYDPSETSGERKIQILQWFQQHPDQRVDRMELYDELHETMGIGPKQIKNYLDDLVEEGVLETHGRKRKAYYLAEDVIPPVKYEAKAALRYLGGIVDYQRWGAVGIAVMTTALWALLAIPFWLFWGILAILPFQTSIGPITQGEFLTLGIMMSIWLVILLAVTVIIYKVRRY